MERLRRPAPLLRVTPGLDRLIRDVSFDGPEERVLMVRSADLGV